MLLCLLILLAFFPKYLTNLSMDVGDEGKKKKKDKDKKLALTNILQNRELIIP